MKVLIDTNVILDFFISRKPHAEDAGKIFEFIINDKFAAFTTASSITDVYYITAKRLGDIEARDVIKQLLKILGVIAVDGSDCVNALELPMGDYEDALVVTCAKKEDIDYIVSNDKEFSEVNATIATVISTKKLVRIVSNKEVVAV